MFWSDTTNNAIYRGNLNGGQTEVLVESNIDLVGKFCNE